MFQLPGLLLQKKKKNKEKPPIYPSSAPTPVLPFWNKPVGHLCCYFLDLTPQICSLNKTFRLCTIFQSTLSSPFRSQLKLHLFQLWNESPRLATPAASRSHSCLLHHYDRVYYCLLSTHLWCQNLASVPWHQIKSQRQSLGWSRNSFIELPGKGDHSRLTMPSKLRVPTWSRWVHEKSLQLCLTLCDPMDHSPPGSSVHGIL